MVGRVVLNAPPFLARAKHITGAIPEVSEVIVGAGLAKRLAPAKPPARALHILLPVA